MFSFNFCICMRRGNIAKRLIWNCVVVGLGEKFRSQLLLPQNVIAINWHNSPNLRNFKWHFLFVVNLRFKISCNCKSMCLFIIAASMLWVVCEHSQVVYHSTIRKPKLTATRNNSRVVENVSEDSDWYGTTELSLTENRTIKEYAHTHRNKVFHPNATCNNKLCVLNLRILNKGELCVCDQSRWVKKWAEQWVGRVPSPHLRNLCRWNCSPPGKWIGHRRTASPGGFSVMCICNYAPAWPFPVYIDRMMMGGSFWNKNLPWIFVWVILGGRQRKCSRDNR